MPDTPEPQQQPAGHDRIILGYERGNCTDDVLRFGTEFARLSDRRPLVVTVLPWPRGYLDRFEGFKRKLDDEVRGEFEAIERDYAELGIETRTIPGPSAAGALHKLAVAEGARAIVVGSAHYGLLGRTLSGSVGESLMYGAPCSIAIVPFGYAREHRGPLGRIAVALDDSDESRIALEVGIELARRAGAELTALTVADPPGLTYGAGWPALMLEELESAEHDRRVGLLNRAEARVPDGIPYDGKVLSGQPGRALSDASADYDLMLTGSRAYGPIRRTVLGSTTKELCRTCSCPALVVPRGVDSDPLGFDAAGQPPELSEATP